VPPRRRDGRSPPLRGACRRCGRAWTRSKAPAQVLPCDAERIQEEADPLLELGPRYDLINKAMLEEELEALESLGELFDDGLARHASSAEADKRAELGQHDDAERSERI